MIKEVIEYKKRAENVNENDGRKVSNARKLWMNTNKIVYKLFSYIEENAKISKTETTIKKNRGKFIIAGERKK